MKEKMTEYREGMKQVNEDHKKNPAVSIASLVFDGILVGFWLGIAAYGLIRYFTGESTNWGIPVFDLVLAVAWCFIVRMDYTSYKIRVQTRDIYNEIAFRNKAWR